MEVRFPKFPTDCLFLAGVFDVCYRFQRTRDGSVVLRCEHEMPLLLVQNWFPCKVTKDHAGYEAMVYGASASTLKYVVSPHTKHAKDEIDVADAGFVLKFVDLLDVPRISCDDPYILGYFFARVGHVTSKTITIEYPFPVDDAYKTVSVDVVDDKHIAVCLNSEIMSLQRCLFYAVPGVPECLDYKSPICSRNRLCIVAAQKLNGSGRFRRAALTKEQMQIIDRHVALGVKSLVKNLGVSAPMVHRYLDHRGSVLPVDPITGEIRKGIDAGKDRDVIRFEIKQKYGIVLSAGAISARKYRYKKLQINPQTTSADTSGQS
jgi:hypothetical protein